MSTKLTLRQVENQVAAAQCGWTPGATSISELTEQEQARRLGLSIDETEQQRIDSEMRRLAARPRVSAAFANARDWRDNEGRNWITPVRDQGNCGSCVAFATVATIEARARIQHAKADWSLDLSEADLFFCGAGRKCDEGWWPSYALEHASRRGVPEEGCFPYQDQDMDCRMADDRDKRLLVVDESQEILDVPARKEFIDQTGPVVACMAVYRDFLYYRSGIYRHVTGDLAGYHAICCVGYSEQDRCWICKNSWGTGWGEQGYFRIAYGESEIDTRFAMYGVKHVSGTLIPGEDEQEESGDAWAELVFAEHSFAPRQSILSAFTKGKWRCKEVTETQLANLGRVMFQASSVRAYYQGNALVKLVGVRKYD